MEEIKLRKLVPTDSVQLAKLANNENVWNNLRDLLPHPYQERDADIFINLTTKETPQQNFGIEYNGELCGAIGVIILKDVYRKSGELGYWIGEPFWGKGIATKAVDLISAYAFETLDLVRIQAGVFEYNAGSIRVLENNGYEREGIFKKAVVKNEKFWDEHRYFKLREE